jgi:hypothetical protein
MDESEEKWINHIKESENPPNILHLHLEKGFNSNIARQSYLAGLPKYMLIGRDNLIIEAFAPYPSSKEMKELIERNIIEQ